MADLLQKKWQQIPEFKELLKANGALVYVEATTGTFWSGGVDMCDISKRTKLSELPGRNILGWLLLYTFLRNETEEPFFFMRHMLQQQKQKSPAIAGLEMVLRNVDDDDEN